MHPDSTLIAGNFKAKYESFFIGKKLLEVGSQDINGSYRNIFQDYEYLGLDILPGPGVDIVSAVHDVFPFDVPCFDIVLSGQTLEHCERPWNTVKEISRVMKPGAICLLIAPWRFHVHKDGRCPLDCWRILEDGMRVLMTDAGLEKLDIYSYGDDCVGIGFKPCH